MSCCPRPERRRRRSALGLPPVLLAGTLALSVALDAAAGRLEDQRHWYREAKQALRQRQLAEFERLLALLGSYPLKPYLEAAALGDRLDTAPAAEVEALLQAYPGVPPVERLRIRWLRRLAGEHRHRELLALYRPQADPALRCSHLNARLEAGLGAAFEADLWLVGHSQPNSCDPVFAHFKAAGAIGDALYWERARLAARAGDRRLANYLARGLGPERRGAIERWASLARDPERALTRALRWADIDINREMLGATLTRLSRSRLEVARAHWHLLKERFAWTLPERAAIERELALYYATEYPPDALAALDALPPAAIDAQILEWRVRVALRADDWAAALSALDDLPPERRERAHWRYWRARAMQASGRAAEADDLFRSLAAEANYYGFLSAERLGIDYVLCPQRATPDPAVQAELRARAPMRRALELYHHGELGDARREWNLATAGLTTQALRQAAILAASEGWVDRAILTLADTGHRQDYELRFPLSWKTLVQALAERERLDPSLVYGVMRSESALVTDAVSEAGALGLMQLTRPTARRVARARGWPAPSRAQLYQPEYSIALGSAYLAELLERYGHPLRALAAYNAGPEAVDRWQALNLPEEADRWIETVPYFETRDYLPRVLAFATIYDWRREGKMVPLKLRMPALTDRSGRTDAGVSGSRVPRCPQAAKGAASE